jgi:hypothetical protein
MARLKSSIRQFIALQELKAKVCSTEPQHTRKRSQSIHVREEDFLLKTEYRFSKKNLAINVDRIYLSEILGIVHSV